MAQVSVVIPAFNAQRTLGDAIDSVLAQSFSDLEVIVVDDGSRDGTASVATSYGSPVRCLSTENRGVSHARNIGLDAATAELIAFLDADDLWKPEKLERQLDLLDSTPASGVCTTASYKVNQDLETVELMAARGAADPCRELLLHSMVLGQISSPLLRRRLALDIGGFNTRFSQSADWDFFIRLALRTQFAVISEPLVLYRTGPANMSHDITLLERDTFAVLDSFFARDEAMHYQPLRRQCYSNHWMILAGSYLGAKDGRAAVRCLIRGISMHPRNFTRVVGRPMRRISRRRRTARRRLPEGW